MWPVFVALGAVGVGIWLLSRPAKATANETPIASGGTSGKIGGSVSGIVSGGTASGSASGGASGTVDLGKLAEVVKEKTGDVKVTLPVVSGDIASTPTPGKWYEIRDEDNGGTFVAVKAYPGRRPLPTWQTVVKHPTNQAAPLSGGGDENGSKWFLPKWNGRGSSFGSGHRYAVVYLPVL